MPLTGNPTRKQSAQQWWILGKRRTWWWRIAKGSPSASCRPARAPRCTSRLYLGTGHSHCWAGCCTNTHAMLAHTGHHVFTLVRAAAAAVLEAVQMHTLCWHTLYISSLPWYGPQPLLGLMLHKHAHYAGTHSFLLFFCPIICANLRGTALVPPIPASPPPATPKTHSASRPITRCPLEETSDHWWAAIWRRRCTAAKSLWWSSVINACSDSTYAGHPLLHTPTDDNVS